MGTGAPTSPGGRVRRGASRGEKTHAPPPPSTSSSPRDPPSPVLLACPGWLAARGRLGHAPAHGRPDPVPARPWGASPLRIRSGAFTCRRSSHPSGPWASCCLLRPRRVGGKLARRSRHCCSPLWPRSATCTASGLAHMDHCCRSIGTAVLVRHSGRPWWQLGCFPLWRYFVFLVQPLPLSVLLVAPSRSWCPVELVLFAGSSVARLPDFVQRKYHARRVGRCPTSAWGGALPSHNLATIWVP